MNYKDSKTLCICTQKFILGCFGAYDDEEEV